MFRNDFGASSAESAGGGESSESAPRALSGMASEGVVSTCGNSCCLRAISPFPLLTQVEPQMKFISNLLCLRSTASSRGCRFRTSFAKFQVSIAIGGAAILPQKCIRLSLFSILPSGQLLSKHSPNRLSLWPAQDMRVRKPGADLSHCERNALLL